MVYIPKYNDDRRETFRSKIERIERIMERFEEQDERRAKKKFKIPMGMRTGSKGKIKKGHVLVFLLRTNGNVDIKFLPIKYDMIYINENRTFHLAGSKYVFRYKKYPAIILPEWDLQPICPKELYDDAVDKGRTAWSQVPILDAMLLSQIKPKKSFGGMLTIGIIIAAVVGVYLITQLITGG